MRFGIKSERTEGFINGIWQIHPASALTMSSSRSKQSHRCSISTWISFKPNGRAWSTSDNSCKSTICSRWGIASRSLSSQQSIPKSFRNKSLRNHGDPRPPPQIIAVTRKRPGFAQLPSIHYPSSHHASRACTSQKRVASRCLRANVVVRSVPRNELSNPIFDRCRRSESDSFA